MNDGPGRGIDWRPVLWCALWALAVGAALVLRPLLPIDETRYVSAAWEMWRDGTFLVPHLNGEPYHHKPPLLFWLIHAGWAAFGVNDWWPRLVAPLAALLALFLTGVLARRLWPDDRYTPGTAPLILIGSLMWAVYATVTMFDMLVAAAALLGLVGLASVWRTGRRTGWAVFGLAVGLGVLAKGPVILVHLLPVALAAPLWDDDRAIGRRPGGWRAWYLGVLAGVGLGAAIALAWAVPAAILGGETYREAIFWGQTAGRMVDSFAHQEPWWWFFVVIPVAALPWLAWPPLWRALGAVWRERNLNGRRRFDTGWRFLYVWLVAAFIFFSLISGKQPHYMIPELPALAIMAARLMTGPMADARRWDVAPLALLAAAVAATAGVLAFGGRWIGLPGWELPRLDALWALLPAVAVLVLVRWPVRGVGPVAIVAVLAVVAVNGIARPTLSAAHDVGAVARHIAEIQAGGGTVINVGEYYGQYQFIGRLEQPLVVAQCDAIEGKLAEHPGATVVAYYRDGLPTGATGEGGEPLLVTPYRGRTLALWPAAAVLASETPRTFVGCD